MKLTIDSKRFAHLSDDEIECEVGDEELDGGNVIAFYRSDADGEWYVRFGHKTAGACVHIGVTLKVGEYESKALAELHDAAETINVFGVGDWTDS